MSTTVDLAWLCRLHKVELNVPAALKQEIVDELAATETSS